MSSSVDPERPASMAGLVYRQLSPGGRHITHPCREPFMPLGVRPAKTGHAVGKFFLIIIAVSVAVLLAASVYIISL